MAPIDPAELPGWEASWSRQWFGTDFYALLGVHPETSTKKDITAAHHRRRRELNEIKRRAQDAGGRADAARAEEREKLVGLAAEVLESDDSRARYDRYLVWEGRRARGAPSEQQASSGTPPRQPPVPPGPPPRQAPQYAATPPESSFFDPSLLNGRDETLRVRVGYALWLDGFSVTHRGRRLTCHAANESLSYSFPGLGVPAALGPGVGDLVVLATVTDPPRGRDDKVTVRPSRRRRLEGFVVKAADGRELEVPGGLRPGTHGFPGYGYGGPLGGPCGNLRLTIKRPQAGGVLATMLMLVLLTGAGAWYFWHTGQSPAAVVRSFEHTRT